MEGSPVDGEEAEKQKPANQTVKKRIKTLISPQEGNSGIQTAEQLLKNSKKCQATVKEHL